MQKNLDFTGFFRHFMIESNGKSACSGQKLGATFYKGESCPEQESSPLYQPTTAQGENKVPQEAKDIQLTQLKDMVRQLNTTVAALTGTIQEKDAAIAKLTEEV